MDLEKYTAFNRSIFYDEKQNQEEYQAVPQAIEQHISPEELKEVLCKHFDASKSSGSSQLPLQVLKHLGSKGIECVTEFLNNTAID